MKVILLQDVKPHGKKGDLVEINDGYARNFILPKKLGVEANSANMNDLKLQKANQEKVAAEQLAEAKALAEKIEKLKVKMTIKTGEGGRTFGSITAKEIAEALKAQHGIDIDKKKISMRDAIKNIGEFSVVIKLHTKVSATLSVSVDAQ
ncbi:MAG: 50S ribosomal protein L9 [Lachnospiraceae bacterium]|jgi:large subunit ribosomal protein L9|nr:50S ribosomal protein L9 [Lachnospiraceae bacterium]MBP5564531.1 50S ribosomal protein L9 [Lachnospiraceae bacterium]